MSQTLTAAFLKANHIYFAPKTENELAYLLRRLTQAGLEWAGETDTVSPAFNGKILKNGLNVDNGGRIYAGFDNSKPCIRGHLQNFPGFDPMDILTAEQKELRALRAEVSDLHAKIDRLLQLIEPPVLGKDIGLAAKGRLP